MKHLGLMLFLSFGIATGTASGIVPVKETTNYEVFKYTFTYAPDNRIETKPHFTSDIYFSQSYFEHSSYEYDEHLSTASFCLSVSTYPDYGNYDEEWYVTQSKFIKNTLETIGFNSFTTNEDYLQTARFDSIGLAIAKKEFNDYTIIAATPRSGGYYREWANNMHLGI